MSVTLVQPRHPVEAEVSEGQSERELGHNAELADEMNRLEQEELMQRQQQQHREMLAALRELARYD